VHDKDTELGLAAESFALGLVLDQGELVVDVVLEFADGVSGASASCPERQPAVTRHALRMSEIRCVISGQEDGPLG